MAWVPTIDAGRSDAKVSRRATGGVNTYVAMLLMVMMLPYLVRWIWLFVVLIGGLVAATVASWRGTRSVVARRRERSRLRADLAAGVAHRVQGTVRAVADGGSHAVRVETVAVDGRQRRCAQVVPFALETDDGRLVLVDPTHGYVASSVPTLKVGERVAVLGRRAETSLDFLVPDRRGYRDGDHPLTLGGRLDRPIFLSLPRR